MFPRAYSIAHLRIAPNVVLSPMEGVTDLTFRRLIRQIGGVGLTVTEFIASAGLNHRSKLLEMARIDPDEHPVAIQLFGRDAQAMADAAKIVEELGADICDINMGCPSKKVCAHSGGSALMKEPEHAASIVKAVVAAVKIPVTVKMRSGFDAERRNAPDLAWICQEEGAQAVAIHWRTREDRYGGVRAVDKIAEAKARLRIPVLGNGDIVDVDSARRMFEDTGCDGVLIGRGAIRDPWLPLRVSRWLNGEPDVVVDAAERRRVMVGYLDGLIEAFRVDHGALNRFKMLANTFCRPLPGGAQLRDELLHSQCTDEARELAERYFERLGRHERGEAVFEAMAG